MQEPGESYELLKVAEGGCHFETITTDAILRDWLVFGIKHQQAQKDLFFAKPI